MTDIHVSSDVAFTPAVKAIQTRKGSRESYARVEERGGWRTEIDENLAAFISEQTSFSWPHPRLMGSLTSSIAVAPPVSFTFWTRARSRSRISAVTSSTSRREICRRTRRRTFS